eukprot:336207-Hanusia_phi.AAC.1
MKRDVLASHGCCVRDWSNAGETFKVYHWKPLCKYALYTQKCKEDIEFASILFEKASEAAPHSAEVVDFWFVSSVHLCYQLLVGYAQFCIGTSDKASERSFPSRFRGCDRVAERTTADVTS